MEGITSPPITRRNHYIPAAITGAFAALPLPVLRYSVVHWAMKGRGAMPPCSAESRFRRTDLYTLPRDSEPQWTGLRRFTWSRVLPSGTELVVRENSLESDLAALGVGNALRPDVLEIMFAARHDTPFAELAQRLRTGGEPTPSDLELCRAFVGTAFFRGPGWSTSATARRSLRASLRRTRRSLAPAFGEAAWNHPVAVAQREVVLDMSRQLALASQIREGSPMDDRFVVELLLAPDGLGFALGDNAARWYSMAQDPRHLAPVGLGMLAPDVVITFPIGPRHCLRLIHRVAGPRFLRLAASDDEVRRINTAQLTLSHREIVFPGNLTDLFLPGVTVASSMPWREP